MNFTEIDDDSEHSTHTPAERAKAASRTTWVSVVVNVVLSTTQIVVGVLAKSQGLVADGIHSLSDLVADFVVLLAGHHSQKDADVDHPYGHQRFENAASLVLGLLLLIVGLMVGKMGWSFGWDALHDLMDRAVNEEEVDAIRTTLRETPGVSGVHDVRTRKMGDMVVVDAHIEVDANLTVEEGHNIAVAARQAVMRRHRVLNLMTHVDPAHRHDADHDAVLH